MRILMTPCSFCFIGDSQDEAAKEAYQSLFIVTLTVPAGPRWDSFTQEVAIRAERDYGFSYEDESVSGLPIYEWS